MTLNPIILDQAKELAKDLDKPLSQVIDLAMELYLRYTGKDKDPLETDIKELALRVRTLEREMLELRSGNSGAPASQTTHPGPHIIRPGGPLAPGNVAPGGVTAIRPPLTATDNDVAYVDQVTENEPQEHEGPYQ